MYKSSFGIKNFAKNYQNPFKKKDNIEFHKNSSPQKIQIRKSFLPKILGLSRTGIKLLLYFIENTGGDTEMVYFKLNECKKFSGFNDKRSIYNGLVELLGENIIARTENGNFYFLNLEIIEISG